MYALESTAVTTVNEAHRDSEEGPLGSASDSGRDDYDDGRFPVHRAGHRSSISVTGLEDEFEVWGGINYQTYDHEDTSADEGGTPPLDSAQVIAEASATELQAAISRALHAASEPDPLAQDKDISESISLPDASDDDESDDDESNDVANSILACIDPPVVQGELRRV